MQQPTWAPNATGNVATRSVALLCLGDSGVHVAIVVTLTPHVRKRKKEKVTKTKPYKLKLGERREEEEMLCERENVTRERPR